MTAINVGRRSADQGMMSRARAELPVTALRRSFERARKLSPGEQIRDCVHQLTHPEELAGYVVDAFEVIDLSCLDLEVNDPEEPDEKTGYDGPPTAVEGYIWASRELMVLGDRCSFTCIATNLLDPNPASSPRNAEQLSAGLDYVGLTCDDTGTLVLGAVQAPGDESAYPLLLRLFACLTEIAPPSQLEAMNRRHLMGIAGPSPRFDLNLVLWDREDAPETSPICELTRDLAEKLKEALLTSKSFPPILRDVVCLRMNPDRFDGRMRFEWRV